MSDFTQLRDGKLSPAQFVTKVTGEFKGNPIVQAFLPIILSALQVELTAATKSPTLAAMIVASIAAAMRGDTPSMTENITGAVSAALHLPTAPITPEAA